MAKKNGPAPHRVRSPALQQLLDEAEQLQVRTVLRPEAPTRRPPVSRSLPVEAVPAELAPVEVPTVDNELAEVPTDGGWADEPAEAPVVVAEEPALNEGPIQDGEWVEDEESDQHDEWAQGEELVPDEESDQHEESAQDAESTQDEESIPDEEAVPDEEWAQHEEWAQDEESARDRQWALDEVPAQMSPVELARRSILAMPTTAPVRKPRRRAAVVLSAAGAVGVVGAVLLVTLGVRGSDATSHENPGPAVTPAGANPAVTPTIQVLATSVVSTPTRPAGSSAPPRATQRPAVRPPATPVPPTGSSSAPSRPRFVLAPSGPTSVRAGDENPGTVLTGAPKLSGWVPLLVSPDAAGRTTG